MSFQVCISLIQLASMNVFVLFDNWKTLFFTQIYRYLEVWCNHHVAAFSEANVLKEVCILCSL